jgi:hypothetical protein
LFGRVLLNGNYGKAICRLSYLRKEKIHESRSDIERSAQ